MPVRKALPDTNIILRYLLKDDEAQFVSASELFEAVRGGARKAVILESVLVECMYILVKHYKVPKQTAVESLSGLLHYRGIINSDREQLLTALAMHSEKKLDIADCILLAKGNREGYEVCTFDKAPIKAATR